jgi:tape measure domain-containing protein
LGSIEKLKSSLNFTGASKGLTTVGSSINGLSSNFRPLNKSIDSVRAHFSVLNVAAGAVIGHIAIQLTNMAERVTKAFTIGPIIQGMDIYTTKLQAIQTILANTQAAGTKMRDVNAALNQLNIYSNKTIYSFGQMTKNIGTFTAAGVGLKPAVSAIKGIANLAALSGSNSDQAATAMYQLSQAISAGRVSLQDWNSVVNAGLGGTVFQRALTTTAVAMGKLKDGTVQLVGPMKNVKIAGESFRQSIQGGPGKTSWLTSDVLTKTLATFTGDMTDAQLAAEGFNKQQIKDIQATAKTALNAATQVKTFSQLMDVTKETIATGWAQSFELIIGNLSEAKKLFTDISNTLNNVINQSAASRNKILGDWKTLGGRTELLDALKRVFQDLGDVLKPVRDAFRDIFPRKTGKDLYDLTVRFDHLAKILKPSPETVDKLRRTFAGIFAILDIGKQVITGAIGLFARLFGAVGVGSGNFLNITAAIGDFLVALDKSLKTGKGLDNFFHGLGNVLIVPIKLFKEIGKAISQMFDGFSPGPFSVNMDLSTKAAEPFKKVLDVITNSLQGLGPAISNAIQHMNFELILETIRTGLLVGLVLMIKHFIGGTTLERVLGIFGNNLGKGFVRNLGGGILGNLSKTFSGLTGSLKAMQQNLQAKTLEEIAIAIALLSASVVALSFVKPDRLNSALTAMAIGFGELIGVMVLMNKLTDAKATLKLPIIAASLVLMATAIDILAIAVFALSKLSFAELSKGLGAIAILLGTLSVATQFLSKNAIGMTIAGAALTEIAIALNIMALAVKQFGNMDLITLGKGLGAIAGSLVAIAIGMRLMPKTLPITGAGLVIVAAALNILAKDMAAFGSMDLKTIGKGLIGIGGGLVIIAGAMQLMPKNMIITAAGLLIVADSLSKIVSAVSRMSGMTIEKLAKGLISLAISLGILAAALHVMSGTLGGAAALAIAAAGIALFVPALIRLGKQSWGSIIKSMVALGAGFALIAAAGLLIGPAVPVLIGFGAALILIGAGLTLAGAGIALIGLGLSSIAIAGPTAIGILIQSLIDLTKALPIMVRNLVLSLLEIVKTFAKVAPQFVKALVKIIDSLSQAVTESAPKMAEAFVVLITEALKSIDKHADEIIQAGFDILEKLLQGINDNIGKVVTMAVTIVLTLIDSLAKNADRLIGAGFNLIINIITGITNNINRLISAGANVIINFLKGIGNNIDKVVTAGINIFTNLITGISNNIGRMVSEGGKAIAHFITGIGNADVNIITAGTNTMIKFIQALGKNSVRLTNAGFITIIKFLNGIADSIDKHEPDLIKAGFRIGQAIVTGMAKGLADIPLNVAGKAKDLGKSAIKHLGGVLGIGSPSRETHKIGRFFVQGFINGIDATSSNAYSSVSNFGNNLLNAMNTILISDLVDTEPKITPVLDLSSIQSGASKIHSIINKDSLGTISLNHASIISARQSGAESTDSVIQSQNGSSIKFEQNNFSPRALTPMEVYRQTRNQLSQLRSATVPT